MNIIYLILGTIILSLFVGSITFFIIEATNMKNRDRQVVGGCQTTLYGCCPDKKTARNKNGSNC
jgi:hypothetical protein